ncbi:unnamed protein product [Auanema sp. JU1783]|nr:unnamed protein product [Auanema sp. JU1783]
MDGSNTPSTSTQDIFKTDYGYHSERHQYNPHVPLKPFMAMRQSEMLSSNSQHHTGDDDCLDQYSNNELTARYIAKVANTFGRPTSRTSYANQKGGNLSTHGAIYERLRRIEVNCDLGEMVCGVDMCGRVFESIPDLSVKSNGLSTCLVCGLQLRSAKGRNAHLMSKHRNLAAEHNSQCLEQRDTIISPLAPAAQRLHLLGSRIEVSEDGFLSYSDEDVLSSGPVMRTSDHHMSLHS